ncbi:hypothetical protein F5B20DRAFT_588591 [Whalleya microplaca]|nr:hypothetical protein F5B20DRAFT_588591 [Whalleya microplaca]
MEPIAITGFSFKLPQGAEDEDSLWEVLANGKNLMTEWPKDRVNVEGFHDGGSRKPNTLYSRGGHFLQGQIQAFDAPFFSIMAKDAAVMDPSQRMALEVAYHTFENAGIPLSALKGSKTAVLAAMAADDYSRFYSRDLDQAPRTVSIGTVQSMLPNRLSWYFNLKGPSALVDTACSSSLVAFDMACQYLKSGDATAALVIGSNLMLGPDCSILLGNMNFLSPDSVCYSFDHRANGFARGEGVIGMVLKPLSNALRDGDMVRAVIRSHGSNQDGRTPGVTQPNPEAQEALIRHVYQKAKLGFEATRLVEAHGTGTPVGDPIEIKAVGRVFRASRSAENPLYVGSIKSNIGHLEGSSGLAGVLKSILALEKGLIPPNANFDKMNPDIDAEFYHTQVPTKPIPWPCNGLRRVSVSSYGFGATNAHLILDDAFNYLNFYELDGNHNCTVTALTDRCVNDLQTSDMDEGIMNAHIDTVLAGDDNAEINGANGEIATNRSRTGEHESSFKEGPDERDNIRSSEHMSSFHPRLLVWSGADTGAVKRVVEDYGTYYETRVLGDQAMLDRLAYTLAARRSELLWRTYAVLHTGDKTEERMGIKTTKAVRTATERGLAFAFTGQGVQYSGMGLELLRYSVFSKTLDDIGRIYKDLGAGWSIMNAIRDETNINRPEYSQPLCTAIQIALVHLLRSMGVVPNMVIGHSSGEIVAAVAYYRGKLAGKLKSTVEKPGAMISVNMSEEEAIDYIKTIQSHTDVPLHVACINSSTNCTLSGDENAIDHLKQKLDDEQIFAQKLNTGIAYHSPAMRAIEYEYNASIGALSSSQPDDMITMVSSVTGNLISHVELSQARYWVDNLVSPVRFLDAVAVLVQGSSKLEVAGNETVTDIIEIGPHCALRRPIRDIVSDVQRKQQVRYTFSLDRNSSPISSILNLIGHLFSYGYPVSVIEANQQGPRSGNTTPFLVDCPKYPFDHSRKYWIESRLSRDYRLREHGPNDILGVPSHDWNPLEPRWRNFLSIENLSWLGDHVINDTIILPATGMLVMAAEAVKQVGVANRKLTGYYFKEAEFLNAIVINEDGKTETTLQLRPIQDSYDKESTWFKVTIFSYANDHWSTCFTATVQIRYQDAATQVDCGKESRLADEQICRQINDAESSCQKMVDTDSFYKTAKEVGFKYGKTFQLLEDLRWDGLDTSIARVSLDSVESTTCFIHPAVLDAGFHLPVTQYTDGISRDLNTYVPRILHDTWISADGWQDASSIKYMTARKRQNDDVGVTTVIQALGDNQTPLCVVGGLVSFPVASNESMNPTRLKLLYGVDWKPQLSLMSPQQLHEWCEADNIPEDETNMVEYYPTLEACLSILISRVLSKLNEDDLKQTPEFLLKLVDWMRRYTNESSCDSPWVPSDISEDGLVALLQRLAETRPSSRLYPEVGLNLHAIIRGETDPLDLVYGTGLAERYYHEIFERNCDFRLRKLLDLASHENPDLRILEVGAGTGTMTQQVLDSLQAFEETSSARKFHKYIFTDISPSFFEASKDKFAAFDDRMQYKKFDLEFDPCDQGFEACDFDLIIAGSVLHATSDLGKVLRNLRKLLKPGGRIVYLEILAPYAVTSNIGFGVLPGWWLAVEPWRQHGPAVSEHKWNELLKENGFSGHDLVLRDFKSDACHLSGIMVSTAIQGGSGREADSGPLANLLLVVESQSNRQINIAYSLRRHFSKSSRYREVKLVSLTDLSTTAVSPCDVAIVLIELDSVLLYNISDSYFLALQVLMGKIRKLLWVMASNIQEGGDLSFPHRSLSVGFLRSMRSEDMERQFVTLSIDEESAYFDWYSDLITRIFGTSFEGKQAPEEVEYVFRDGQIQTGRLCEKVHLNKKVRGLITPEPRAELWKPGPPLKLSIGTNGMLDTLEFTEDISYGEAIQPTDFVQIEAKVWGLNFRDLFVALGRIPGQVFGNDCSGVVSKAGPDSGFKPGDRVFLSTPGCMRMYPSSTSDQVIKIPDSMSFEVAASFITPGVTAYYSLIKVAQLQKGEKILIHSAAGSTGQMALQFAKMVGAEIFATVGFDEKRQLLVDKYGILEENIFHSRDTSFARGIMRVTNGYGVDVVLNSLSGDGLRASWECMAPYGRFIEIGKADIMGNSSLPMSGFARNVSFFAVDLYHLALSNRSLEAEMVHQVMDLVSQGHIDHPSPLHRYPVSEVERAFRFMQSGKNSGRTIITINDSDVVKKRILNCSQWRCYRDASYLIAGGSGGIGRAILRWLASKGARYLIVPSRSGGVNSMAAANLVSELREQGVTVVTPACDVSSASSLSAMLNSCSSEMPPIRGCINAAMVLQDAVFHNMTHAQWDLTIRSKAHTAWNLHELLPRTLDFFIMLSSLDGIYGNAAQSNYSAGCVFQDSLCYHRTRHGQKAVSFDIGWMRTIGIIAETEKFQQRQQNVTSIGQIEDEDFMALLDLYCDPTLPILLTPAHLLAKGQPVPTFGQRRLFSGFTNAAGNGGHGSGGHDIVDVGALFRQATGMKERADIVVKALVSKLTRALSISPDDIDVDKYLSDYGVDSLMAVELRNWIGNDFQANVAIFDIMGGTTMTAIGDLIALRSDLSLENEINKE